MEFHIRRDIREEFGLEEGLFSLQGNVILANFREVREFAARINAKADPAHPERFVRAGQLNAMGLIDEILHYVVALYREQVQNDVFETALGHLETEIGGGETAALLENFNGQFPPREVYGGKTTPAEYLAGSDGGESNRALSLEEIMLLALSNMNPAFNIFKFFFDDTDLSKKTHYERAIKELQAHLAKMPVFGPDGMNLWDLLRAPALASPDSLAGQLEYMRRHWGLILGKFMARLLTSLDVIKEEEKPSFFGPGPTEAYTYGALENEYEKFTPDQEWMPRTVLLAKSTLVWLFQMSQKYGQEITRLDQIPDKELDELAHRGFTGLWLIGLWERSNASKTIKQWTGNPEAAASAYSLYDYDIAGELGGWDALTNLRDRCSRRGIRLGSDMVPNHTGIDSRWVVEHPDRFLQLPYPPFPTYNYNCGNLSGRDDITVQIEEHYFTRSDAAVVFKRIDNRSGSVRYIYHGNDGTSMPWNDTAQIDFLNPEAREAVIQTIVGVCKQFSIVRFDAAMTLAKRHIQRLWYPEPGRGGDIASRSEHAISLEEFNRRIPNEFWREVVDRCAAEAPHTLLLAEAFWMMEGYFVRTLGMHRVYNSAFMNMLKKEENSKYRDTIKNTIEFDPEILKRFVNFMNNPDEDTAVAQFGKGDKYFGICTLMVTMPGLPMFGHGQIEGFEEKYGMEYRRSYKDEKPDGFLVERHEREIFPLMKRRNVFSGSASFCLYDFYTGEGSVNENVFAYSNRDGEDRALVLYNNSYSSTAGWIHRGAVGQGTLSGALSLRNGDKFFTLLREQRSGLWFIRSSKEISEKGLFASLDGYGAQVFMDIHEVEDAASGRWARLHVELKGRGAPNLENAIQDIFLAGLYEPFVELFSVERMQDLTLILQTKEGRAEKGEAFIKDLWEPALRFITAAAHFLDGGKGDYDAFKTADLQHKSLRSDEIWEDLSAYLRRIFALADYADTPPAGAGKAIKTIFKELEEELARGPGLAAFTAGYGALSILRSVIGAGASGSEAAALMDHWGLDRKLRECWAALGIDDGKTWQLSCLMGSILRRTNPLIIPSKEERDSGAPPIHKQPTAETLIVENYDAEDFRTMLGVNLFDGVIWFNKECFERALHYAPLFLMLDTTAESEAAWQKYINLVAAIAEQFRAAEEVSGYRFDGLLAALGEDKPVANIKGRKNEPRNDL
ncbi:alpha-amylase [Spirochaetia bacterium]|nr:alpha-amylase [Spirochaetia bacterium]